MQFKQSFCRLAATAAAILFAAAVANAQGHDHAQMQGQMQDQMQAQEQKQVLKVGKKGDIVFTEATQIGNITLKPGHYSFQHRVADGQHFVEFTELQMVQGRHSTGQLIGAKQAGEIQCTLEPLKEKATQTAVYAEMTGGVRKVTRIEVAGENVAHIL